MELHGITSEVFDEHFCIEPCADFCMELSLRYATPAHDNRDEFHPVYSSLFTVLCDV